MSDAQTHFAVSCDLKVLKQRPAVMRMTNCSTQAAVRAVDNSEWKLCGSSGSMLIRRSKWSLWFLQHLYNEHRVWQQGGQRGQEQGAINQFANGHSFHFDRHTGIVPYEVFNNHRSANTLCDRLTASIACNLATKVHAMSGMQCFAVEVGMAANLTILCVT